MESTLKISLLFFCFFLGISSIEAQNEELLKNLTHEQKELIKEQRRLVLTNREAFKASLTAKQLAILDSKELSKQEKQQVLASSLSDIQKKMMSDNKTAIDALQDRFKSMLTTEQRLQMMSQHKDRAHQMTTETGGHKKHH